MPIRKPKPLSWLPNKAGFEFFGVRKNGTLAKCAVACNPDTKMHFITGEAVYSELIGWFNK